MSVAIRISLSLLRIVRYLASLAAGLFKELNTFGENRTAGVGRAVRAQ